MYKNCMKSKKKQKAVLNPDSNPKPIWIQIYLINLGLDRGSTKKIEFGLDLAEPNPDSIYVHS